MNSENLSWPTFTTSVVLGICLKSLFPPFLSAALADRLIDLLFSPWLVPDSTPADSPHSVKLMSCKNSINAPPQCSFFPIFC